jgi:hypothetical protein
MTVLLLSVLAVVSAAGAPTPSDQAARNPPRVNACTILTPEIAAKFAAAAKIKITTRPVESAVGSGSQCDYEGITLQIDPFAAVSADRMRKTPGRDWVPVGGVGDAAFFRDVQNIVAEMYVWSGARHFGFVIDVPADSTSEKLKPGLIELANLVVPKLK